MPPEPEDTALIERMRRDLGEVGREIAAQMRNSGLGIVASDAFFAAAGAPPEAARICLGGALNRAELSHALEFLAPVLTESPAMVSGII